VTKQRRKGRPTGFRGNVVSFAAFAKNRPRRLIADHEPRGQVLLFTGVRYEYDSTAIRVTALLLTDLSASCREAPRDC
jgi:hypothetical protein